MKKFFITIGILVLGLSIFGMYDNSQKKKEKEALEAKTSMFTATVESIEGADGEKKVTVAVNDEESNNEKFKGKKYSFTEGKTEKLEVINESNEKAELKDLEVGKTIAIQNIGDVKEGDINELLGELKVMVITKAQGAQEPTKVPTDTPSTPTTEATEAPAQ